MTVELACTANHASFKVFSLSFSIFYYYFRRIQFPESFCKRIIGTVHIHKSQVSKEQLLERNLYGKPFVAFNILCENEQRPQFLFNFL